MSERTFHADLEDAAGHVLDATCAARAATTSRIPPQHRRWVSLAIADLERAQIKLWKARHDPWSTPPKPKSHQLELL